MVFTSEQIDMIRRESERFELDMEISDRLLEFMYDQQLFKLIVPEAFGGKMLDLPDAVNIFQQSSYADGNFGWLVTVGSGGGMFAPNTIEETARSYYSPKNAVVAGSGFPAGIARPTDNGYMINGKWFYCSGSQFATLFTASCVVKGENEDDDEILAFVFDPDQVEVQGDWDAFGLKATSSHSIEVKEQFVPQERAFALSDIQHENSGPVHTFPFMLFSQASFGAITLGIADHFLEEVDHILETNKPNWQNGSFDRYAFLKDKLNGEKKRWKEANQAFHRVIQTSWNQHVQEGGEISDDLQNEFSTIAKGCATTSIECASNLFRFIGMQAVMEHNTLNRIWRDLHTAAQHVFLTPYHEKEATPY